MIFGGIGSYEGFVQEISAVPVVGTGVDSRGRDMELSGEAYFSMLEETAFFTGRMKGLMEKLR